MATWQETRMNQIRELMRRADPEIVEEMKWKKPSNPDGVYAWSLDGLISTGETYKMHLRLTLGKGLALKEFDPTGIINAHRAILIHEEDKLDEEAFVNLIRMAVQLNKEHQAMKVKSKK